MSLVTKNIESIQAAKLNELVKKYADQGVVFGSYPAWVNNYYKARLTVEAASEDILEQVDQDVISSLPVIEGFDKSPEFNSMIKIERLLASWQGSRFRVCT